MSRSHDNLGRTVLLERLCCGHDCAAGVDHVVNQQAGASIYVTNKFVRLNLVWSIWVAALVNDRKRCAKTLSPDVSNANATRVW